MKSEDIPLARKIDRLRRTLPVSGYPRPTLLMELRIRKAVGRSTPKLKVIDIFDVGNGQALMCRFLVCEHDARSFIAPLSQIALDRCHRPAQAVAMHRGPSRAGVA